MMEINKKITEALMKMQFIRRYEEISKNFNAERTPSNKRLIYIDGEEVMEMIQEMGYDAIFV